MRTFKRALIIGVAALGTLLVPLVGIGHASADYAPQPSDVVGIGGDTPQYAVDFALNGDTAGDLGYDASKVNRAIFFDAVADGNGRAAYTSNVNTGTNSVVLNPTDVLRAGTVPVQRNQSSGAGITALLADTATPETINFVGSASLPTTAQQTQAGTNGWGFLHVVEIGTDSVKIAAATTTNAPAAGLTAAQLLTIYTTNNATWSGLGLGSSTATITPEIPPSTSTIYKTLIADLTTANGGVAPSLATYVKTVEQNDPTAVSGNPNAIVPFSAGRLNLWNSGYFHSPSTVFPGSGTSLSAGVSLLAGYTSPITDYVIFRQSDLTSSTPFQPGGTQSWAQTLFSGTAPFFARSSGQTLLAAAGITPSYNDLGDVHQ